MRAAPPGHLTENPEECNFVEACPRMTHDMIPLQSVARVL